MSCRIINRVYYRTTVMIFAIVALTGLCMSVEAETPSPKLTLEQVIREACTQSDSVKMMKESVTKTELVVREKRSAAFPKLSTSFSASYDAPFKKSEENSTMPRLPDSIPLTLGLMNGMIGSFATQKSSTIYNGALSVNQPLYTFGRVGNAIKVAKSYNKSSVTSFVRNLQVLQLSALDLYYRALITTEQAKIAQSSLARKNELYQFLERNFSMGSGIKAQLLMARADAFTQSALALSARQNEETARMQLNVFLGRPLDDLWTIDTSTLPSTLTTPSMIPDTTQISLMIDQRNDIQSLHFLAESNKNGANIYRSLYYPSIYANGSIGYSQIDSKGIMARKGAANWTAGLSLNWTLFDGFENSARAEQTLCDARKIELYIAGIKKAANIEIRSAATECAAADSTLHAAEESYAAAKEAFELTNNNFRQGSGSLTDLQRVDEQLQMTELLLVNSHYRQVRSRAALLVALGRDIVTIEQ